MIFGQTSTICTKRLKFVRRMLLHVLCKHAPAQVRLPSAVEVAECKDAVELKYPSCSDCIGAADGLKLLVEAPESYYEQERYYNGWKADHYVNCIFMFTVDGKIIIAILSAPGSFHDSTIADCGAYTSFERIYNDNWANLVIDSAFQIGTHS